MAEMKGKSQKPWGVFEWLMAVSVLGLGLDLAFRAATGKKLIRGK